MTPAALMASLAFVVPVQHARHPEVNRLHYAKAVAQHVFPVVGQRCPEGVTVTRDPAFLAIGGVTGHCQITLGKKKLDWPYFCTNMVHEYGHLAGLHHSPDTESVMYYGLNLPYPDCIYSPNTGRRFPYDVGKDIFGRSYPRLPHSDYY